MVRSLAKRGMPKPFAIALAALLALYFVPLGVVAPAHAGSGFQYTLEGCRLAAGNTLPDGAGKFVCTDAEYTTGNLGKSWNELDLVPHRVTVSGSGQAQFVVAADNEDAGRPGYDILSAPVINTAKSTAGCSVSSSEQKTLAPGQGGADKTIYRVVTVTVPDRGTCVIDYYQRLALGSHLYPGSSLHANLLNTEFGTAGIGSKEVSIPVKEILPQKIEKTMAATQGSTYAWTLTKSVEPAQLRFTDSCTQSSAPKSASVTVTLDWTRSALTRAGDVTLTTRVTATNPAHRNITVNVTDKMYAGSGQSYLLATHEGTFDVPAESEHTFEFTSTVSSSSATFNDVATATYTDKATGIAVPGSTTAAASAGVTANGQVSGATATISDVESISGAGFSYSANGVTPDVGSFGGYTKGTRTTSDVTWSHTISPSGTGAASGSFSFAKTVYVAAGTVGSGTLADTATLTPAGQSAIEKSKSVALTADAADPRLRFTKKVDIAPTSDATFTFLVRAKDAKGEPTGPTYTFEVTVPGGATSATSAFQAVAPSAYGYAYTETAASGYTGVDGDIAALGKCENQTETVNNTRDLGKIKIEKKLVGEVAGASTSFVAHVDCPGDGYDQDVALNAGNGWIGLTGNIPTGTQCTVTEKDVPAGWKLKSITPETVTVSLGTPTAVTATITNERLLGKVTINKLLEGAVAGASTEFTVELDCDVDAYDRSVVLNAGNSWSRSYDIPAGVTCAVTEPTVPAGWVLKSIDPNGEFTVQAGETVSVYVVNKRLLGTVTINKLLEGAVAGASTEFTVELDCDVDAYDRSVVLNAGNSWSRSYDIPAGVTCAVTEPTVPAGWVLKSIDPNGEFTVQAGETVSVYVVNKRLLGTVTINKLLEGAVAGASTEFTVELDCDVDAYDRSVVLNSGNSWSRSYDIPAGVTCAVTEPTVPAGWVLKSINPNGEFTVGAGQTVTVNVTNERLLGKVTINKLLEGAVAGASTEFTVELDCDVDAYDRSVVLNAGNSWSRSYDIPAGVTCAVTEPTVPAGWVLKSIDPNGEFTVQAGETVSVYVVNKRLLGTVTINKLLEGAVAGASTEFTVELDCDVDAYDRSVVLNAGNSWSRSYDIPAGVTCAVTEPTVPAGWVLKSIDPNGEFTVQAGETVSVYVVNKRLLGTVTINKLLEGAVAGASTEFTVELDCDVDAYDRSVVLNSGNSWSRSYDIPAGVTCAVTEPTVPAGWALKSIHPNGEFTVGAGQTVTVNVTNKRQQGGVVINKRVEGDPINVTTDFTVLLDCDGTDYDRTVHLTKGNGWTATYDGIPAGLKCQVTEPDVPAGWELESITPAGTFTIGTEGRVVVDVLNDREDGDITIVKKIEGDVAGASTDFTVKLDCEGSTYDKTIELNAANRWSKTIEDVPTFVECRVTEPVVPDGWGLKSISPSGTFSAVHDEVVTVTVTNEREVGTVKIVKVLDGDVAGASTEFAVDLDCDGTAYDQARVVLSEANAWTASFGGIPTLVECRVGEPTVPDGWDLESISPAGKFTVGSGATVTVTVTNERRVGSVIVHKTVVGDVAGASTDFTVALDCSGTTYDTSLVLNAGNSWTAFVMGVPTGVSCQVSEPTVPAGWSLTSITPSEGFVVDDVEQAVAVDVVNTRDMGSVEVKKVVTGDVAGASTDFSVLLDCDGTAYDKTLALNAGNSWTARVDSIPTLVQCQVTEPTIPAGWSLTSVNPPGKFTVQKATVATVTVTNARTTGVITVAKVLDGAANGAATSFTFDVDCAGTAYDQSVVVNVTTGTSATGATGQIPTGLTCTVTERATPDWKLTTTVPAGGVVAVGSTVTFTNQRLQGTLNVLKEVSPVAGNGVVVDFGDTLTYTLTVSATGEQRQPNVVVTDYVPGFDPERDESGSTTYVPGSAACVGDGACAVTEPGTDGLITWSLGEMAAGTTRQVNFQVVIDPVPGEAGTTVAVDILNAGAVQSDRTPRTPSNEVVTPVTAVFPVKVGKPPAPAPLPRTGAAVEPAVLAMSAVALLGLGLLLVAAGRRRRVGPPPVQ